MNYGIYFKRALHRHQPKMPTHICVKASIKAMLTLTLLAALSYISTLHLLITPFAASCLNVFINPRGDNAQPVSVIGGYFIATLASIIFLYLLPNQWWVSGIIVAVTIFAMAYLRITHPPAAGVPLVMLLQDTEKPDIFVLFTVMAGAFMIVICAVILQRIMPDRIYPRRLPDEEQKLLEAKK